MAFNHYAKIKRILEDEPPGWYIVKINKSTTAKNFKGEIKHFDHYYRIYSVKNEPIKYCKFQQLSLLAKILKMDELSLPLLDTRNVQI